ncbi:MAG: SDR family NAD(P)-dependent oxidoreductase [Actinomycetota bacterium]|nr:SDR family NAD(P)-dependent oxidoreductase [Actinomycetota bacterium]
MKRVVVTGGAGFIGANLCRRLLAGGHDVRVLVRPGGDCWRLADLRGDVQLLEVDVRDRHAVARLVDSAKPDWVFHLAAHGAYSHQKDLESIVSTNVAGTVNLLEACAKAGFEAFVNAGSSSEYGFKDHPAREDEVLDPNSHYAWTKAAATHYCRFTAVARGLNIATLRLYSAYGPYEEPGRLIPKLIAAALRGRLPPLTDPAIARDFIYVEDVCEAFILAAERPAPEAGAVYNVGTGLQTTLGQLVELVRRRFGIQETPRWGTMAKRSWDTSVWLANNAKIVRELGWKPRYGLEEGLNLFVEWFRSHPELEGVYVQG